MTAQMSLEQREIIEKTANHIISREDTSEHSQNLKAVAELALFALTEMDCEPQASLADQTAAKEKLLDLLAERDADKKRIAEFQRQEHYRTRQAVIDGLAASGECWDDIKEYMEKWDAEAERIELAVGE